MAIEILSTLFLCLTATNAQNAGSQGQWGPIIPFPIIPVGAAMVPGLNQSTQLFTYSSYRATVFGGGSTDWLEYLKFGSQNRYTASAWLDLNTMIFNNYDITDTGHDMFCPGMSLDEQGRIVVTGGSNAEVTSIYDFRYNKWTRGPNMTIPRGYQSSTITSEGKIFTIGGSFTGGIGGQDSQMKHGEVLNAAGTAWTYLPDTRVEPMLTADNGGPWRSDNHAWLFSWRDGFVFQAGPSRTMHWYDTKQQQGGLSPGGQRGGTDQMCGINVMYDIGKILSAGGSPNYAGSDAVATAHIIEIGAPNKAARVRQIAPMANRRGNANSVVLPDGSVLVTGGQTFNRLFSDDFAIRNPELWSPATERWTIMAPEVRARTYHSVSILLPDARVFTGGGGLCWDAGSCDPTADHADGQIFSPPYLFRDGKLAPRPVITAMTFKAARDTSFIVPMGGVFDAVLSGAPSRGVTFSLVRLGSATHSINTDQRRLPLTPTSRNSAGRFTFRLSDTSGTLSPGFWYFFAMVDGVPSLSRTIQVTRQ